MNSEISIRPGTEADVPAIVDLWVEFMDLHRDMDRWYTISEESPGLYGEFVRQRMEDPSSAVIVAEVGERIVGFAVAVISERPALYARRQYATITEVAVTASARRFGAGAKLTEEIVGVLRGKGVTRIEIGALLGNPMSTSFWRKMGFVPYMEKCCLDFEDMSFDQSQSAAAKGSPLPA
jgi:GNAT superfamily N-acetyltransferase